MGKSFTYLYGAVVYTLTFDANGILTTNLPWGDPGTTTWKAIAPDQVELTNAGKTLILTFSSATSYTGIDWDGVTKISGNQDYIAGIVGKSFTYQYGADAYTLTFDVNGILTTNLPWGEPGTTTWKAIVPDQVELTNAGKTLILTFSSATSYTGIDWDGVTKISGSLK